MSDIFSILSTGYASATLNSPTRAVYKNVDPKAYEGTWSGTFNNNQKFEFSISQVNGFRARVKYQSGDDPLSAGADQQRFVPHRRFQVLPLHHQAGHRACQVGRHGPVDGSTTLLQGNAQQTT